MQRMPEGGLAISRVFSFHDNKSKLSDELSENAHQQVSPTNPSVQSQNDKRFGEKYLIFAKAEMSLTLYPGTMLHKLKEIREHGDGKALQGDTFIGHKYQL